MTAELHLVANANHEFIGEPSMMGPMVSEIALFLDRIVLDPQRYVDEALETNFFAKGPEAFARDDGADGQGWRQARLTGQGMPPMCILELDASGGCSCGWVEEQAMKILLTAAAGHQGKLLLPKLSALGHNVRAARISAGKDDELLALGASEVFVGDLTDVDTYTKALEGCDAVYHVGPAGIGNEKEYGSAMIEAARRNGTRHVVMSSVYHTIIDIVQHRWKRDIEEKLFESGLNCTVLRPCDFMVVEHYIDIPLRTGVLPMFWKVKPGRRGSMIDIDDLTDVAAKVLTEGSKHYFANYELAGPDKLTPHEIARILSRVMGKPFAWRSRRPKSS